MISECGLCTSIGMDFISLLYNSKRVCLCIFKILHIMMLFVCLLGAHYVGAESL